MISIFATFYCYYVWLKINIVKQNAASILKDKCLMHARESCNKYHLEF